MNDKIFSGSDSTYMWNDIDNARSKRELRQALYLVCCRLQDLETKYDNLLQEKKNENK